MSSALSEERAAPRASFCAQLRSASSRVVGRPPPFACPSARRARAAVPRTNNATDVEIVHLSLAVRVLVPHVPADLEAVGWYHSPREAGHDERRRRPSRRDAMWERLRARQPRELSDVTQSTRQLSLYYAAHSRRVDLDRMWRASLPKWEKLLESLAPHVLKMAVAPADRRGFLADVVLYARVFPGGAGAAKTNRRRRRQSHRPTHGGPRAKGPQGRAREPRYPVQLQRGHSGAAAKVTKWRVADRER